MNVDSQPVITEGNEFRFFSPAYFWSVIIRLNLWPLST